MRKIVIDAIDKHGCFGSSGVIERGDAAVSASDEIESIECLDARTGVFCDEVGIVKGGGGIGGISF